MDRGGKGEAEGKAAAGHDAAAHPLITALDAAKSKPELDAALRNMLAAVQSGEFTPLVADLTVKARDKKAEVSEAWDVAVAKLFGDVMKAVAAQEAPVCDTCEEKAPTCYCVACEEY